MPMNRIATAVKICKMKPANTSPRHGLENNSTITGHYFHDNSRVATPTLFRMETPLVI